MIEAIAIGIDLAWSPRKATGVAVAEVRRDSVRITTCGLVRTSDEIVQFVAAASKGRPSAVAIDCPTIVPNERGMRPCERELQRRFNKSAAGPYPANRSRLGQCNSGTPRGEEISRALQRHLGAVECGIPMPSCTGTYVIEVFPAPAQVTLFGIPRALPYKKKPWRTWDTCRQALAEYSARLRELTDPRLILPQELVVKEERGQRYKELEDKLDAVMCAYVGALAWLDPSRSEMIGTVTDGYVVVPVVRRVDAEGRAVRR